MLHIWDLHVLNVYMKCVKVHFFVSLGLGVVFCSLSQPTVLHLFL